MRCILTQTTTAVLHNHSYFLIFHRSLSFVLQFITSATLTGQHVLWKQHLHLHPSLCNMHAIVPRVHVGVRVQNQVVILAQTTFTQGNIYSLNSHFLNSSFLKGMILEKNILL